VSEANPRPPFRRLPRPARFRAEAVGESSLHLVAQSTCGPGGLKGRDALDPSRNPQARDGAQRGSRNGRSSASRAFPDTAVPGTTAAQQTPHQVPRTPTPKRPVRQERVRTLKLSVQLPQVPPPPTSSPPHRRLLARKQKYVIRPIPARTASSTIPLTKRGKARSSGATGGGRIWGVCRRKNTSFTPRTFQRDANSRQPL
jgi:hypothetical protein